MCREVGGPAACATFSSPRRGCKWLCIGNAGVPRAWQLLTCTCWPPAVFRASIRTATLARGPVLDAERCSAWGTPKKAFPERSLAAGLAAAAGRCIMDGMVLLAEKAATADIALEWITRRLPETMY